METLDIFVEIVKHQCYGEKCVPQYEHKFAYPKKQSTKYKKNILSDITCDEIWIRRGSQ
jgi:hypothetical protein